MEKEMIPMINEDELSKIVGGKATAATKKSGAKNSAGGEIVTAFCAKCNADTPHTIYSGARAVCNNCGEERMI